MLCNGYIQDLPDSRDRVVESGNILFGSSSPPDEFHALAELFDIHIEQGGESCVGFSGAEAIYAAWRVQGIVKPELPSPLFLWWNSRHAHGAEKLNSGTYIRMMLQRAKSLGFCPDSVYKGTGLEDLFHFDEKPSRAAYRAGIDQQLTDLEHYRINGFGDARVDSWKRSISSNHPIIFGIPIENSFGEYTGRGYIESPKPSAVMVGGHAMCALGYDKNGVFGPNTWPKTWGRNGWFYLEWDYIRQWAMDQWAIVAPPYFSGAS